MDKLKITLIFATAVFFSCLKKSNDKLNFTDEPDDKLTSLTEIIIEKNWAQQPNGYVYPIDIKVPENYVSILKPGLKAEITNSAFNKIFKGKVDSISSRIDPSTRSILARVIVDNSNFEIIPGQLMTVKVIYNEINQIGVPESAVTIQGDTAFVYTINDNKSEKRDIKIGKRNFGKVSVISGISEGDIVVSEGVSKIRNKSKVKILNP